MKKRKTFFKITAVVVAILYMALVMCFMKGATAAPYVRGDVDGDGDVTTNDAYAILVAFAQKSAGADVLFDSSMDVDENGEVNTADAFYVLAHFARRSAGIEPNWDDIIPGGEPKHTETSTTEQSTTTEAQTTENVWTTVPKQTTDVTTEVQKTTVPKQTTDVTTEVQKTTVPKQTTDVTTAELIGDVDVAIYVGVTPENKDGKVNYLYAENGELISGDLSFTDALIKYMGVDKADGTKDDISFNKVLSSGVDESGNRYLYTQYIDGNTTVKIVAKDGAFLMEEKIEKLRSEYGVYAFYTHPAERIKIPVAWKAKEVYSNKEPDRFEYLMWYKDVFYLVEDEDVYDDFVLADLVWKFNAFTIMQ